MYYNKDNANSNYSSDDEVRLEVKPKYCFQYAILPSMIFGIGIIIVCGMQFCSIQFRAGIIMTSMIAVPILLYLIIKAMTTKKLYNKTSYCFCDKKVKVCKNIGELRGRYEINYNDIKEIAIGQSLMQKCFNIGNIMMYISRKSESKISRVYIQDIENIEEIYNIIKEYIEIRRFY